MEVFVKVIDEEFYTAHCICDILLEYTAAGEWKCILCPEADSLEKHGYGTRIHFNVELSMFESKDDPVLVQLIKQTKREIARRRSKTLAHKQKVTSTPQPKSTEKGKKRALSPAKSASSSSAKRGRAGVRTCTTLCATSF
jgi:hypothetical protein